MANQIKKSLKVGDFTLRYFLLILRTYLVVIRVVLLRAKMDLIKGIYYLIRGRREEQHKHFLSGSGKWGDAVIRGTHTRFFKMNEINPPDRGHLIFINHVCELDFPFDCKVMVKPYLANQVIKKTLFAYWWMLAMGSQVFDSSRVRTIAVSVKNLVAGLDTRSFIVYPEGHNTYGEAIKPLKKGMIKIAHENNIPIYITVKSGVAAFLEKNRDNTVGYRFAGKIDSPASFETWEALRDEVFQIMTREKAILDEEILRVAEDKQT